MEQTRYGIDDGLSIGHMGTGEWVILVVFVVLIAWFVWKKL